MSIPTLDQWKRGLQIAEQIAALENELAAILGKQTAPKASKPAVKPARRKKPQQAAQKTRWAKIKAGKKSPAKAKAPVVPAPSMKKKRQISPEGRAKLAALMKAKWDAAKAGTAQAPTARKAPPAPQA